MPRPLGFGSMPGPLVSGSMPGPLMSGRFVYTPVYMVTVAL